MTLPLLGLALLAWPEPTAAIAAQPKPEPPPPTVVTLRPAPEPSPALKYRLLPERQELVPGNAALFYHRAIELVLDRRKKDGPVDPDPRRSESAIADWIAGPLDKIPLDEARKTLEIYPTALHEVDLGARRDSCDWGFEHRTETIELLIPEIQEMRSLARLVALRARVAVLDGDTDEAWRWLQNGYAMARHVGREEFIIQALVGVAIAQTMNTTLLDLIQSPGTPSLYWALAASPRPFVPMGPALEGERLLLEKMLPSLGELESGVWSLDRARRFADDLQDRLQSMTGRGAGGNIPTGGEDSGPPDLRRWGMRLGLAAMVARFYPEAREALIAEGRPAEQVDAMPAIQVAALHTLREYYRTRDDVYKWIYLPYPQSYRPIDEGMQEVQRKGPGENPLLVMFNLIVPALNSARLAEVRLDRQLGAIQCIEAIRLYSDAHGGALPPSLEALAESPAPIDPGTGTPFEYSSDGDTATLSAPPPPGADHPAYQLRYELRLAH